MQNTMYKNGRLLLYTVSFRFNQRNQNAHKCIINNSCSSENIPGVPIYYDDVTRVAWQQYIERLRGLLFSSLRYYTFPMKRTDQNPADQVSQLRGLCRGVMRVHSQFNDLHLKFALPILL